MRARALLAASGCALLGFLGGGGAAAEDAMKQPAARPADAPKNRLASERSPYLRQHQFNPVDWWPWGPEALARAKALDRPIFLSIGYAACHWCHVMEHDSFEDLATAAALNDAFVCVKVDREERPDLDDVYMAATQLTTGRGGWPMTCFLTPDGRPFLARTFIPRAELVRITSRLKQMWKEERSRLVQAADEISDAVRKQAGGRDLPAYEGSDDDLVRFAVERTTAEFDAEHGGFDRVPKFPPHAQLLFLLDLAGAPAAAHGLAMVGKTLQAMAAGGVYDQVGGGFHRYSTDAVWLVPHFEKMLYDNALLATAYARAYAVDGQPRYAEVVRETLGWIEREMKVLGGGYASSLDADTEGEEGLTYTWTPEELAAALPPADARLAAEAYDVRPGGNYHDEASGRPAGRSILHRSEAPAALAARRGQEPAALAADLARIRARLLEVRGKRAQPGRDGKVLSGWNGLLLSAFAIAGTALKDPALHDRGRVLATFLLEQAMDGGRLLRLPKGSGPRIEGFLDDHAHVAEGLLDLAEATGETRWAGAAAGLADAILARFRDPSGGGFFSTSTDHEALLARPKDAFDSPIPSGNATAARVLLRLAARTGSTAYREGADATLAAWRPLVARAPTGTMAMARALADRARLAASGVAPEVADASVRRGVAQMDVFLERGEASPGSSVRVAIRLVLDPGWHVNPPAPVPDDRVASTLELGPKAPVLLGPVTWPLPVTKVPAPGQAAIPMLEGTVWIRASLAVPPAAPLGPRKVALVLSVQPCEAASCRAPVELPVDVPLRFGADAPARHPTLFR